MLKNTNKGVEKSTNNISQISIFDYTEIENLGDLEKLKLFLENVEDDELCEILEKKEKMEEMIIQ